MSDDRRRRFQQIERPRAPGEASADPSPGTDARFGAVVRPGEPAVPPAPPSQGRAEGLPVPPPPTAARPGAGGHVDRFRPAAEQPLQVDDLGAASQPFIRCCRCETDCSRYVAACSTCGASLDTDEQRAFNQRLWAERRTIAASEAEAAAARQVAQAEARAEEARARRAMGEAMAREVGDRERARLEAEERQGLGWPGGGAGGGGWASGGTGGTGDTSGGGWSGGWGGGGWSGGSEPWTPAGLRLLRLIPNPTARVATGVGAVAVAALLYVLKPAAGLVAAVVLISLFVPSGRRRWFGPF